MMSETTTEHAADRGKSLIELNADYARLMGLLMDAGGEITPELEAELAVNEQQLATKADKYDFIIQRLETEESHWKLQADRYAKVARSCSAARERLREAIKFTLKNTGKTEVVGENARFYLANSAPRLIVAPVTQLPPEYVVETIVREPNKDKIKGALKEGVAIPGCALEPVFALRTGVARKVK